MQPIVTLGGESLLAQRLVRRGRPEFGADPVVLGELVDRFAGSALSGPGEQDRCRLQASTSGASPHL